MTEWPGKPVEKDQEWPGQKKDKPDEEKEEKTSILGDTIKSFGRGISKGAISLAGMPGDVRQMITGAAGKLAEKFSTPEKAEEFRKSLEASLKINPMMAGPSSKEITEDVVEPIAGKFDKPKTTPGKFAQSVGEFLPSMAIPGGSLPMRALSAVGGGVGSEALGEVAEGGPLEGVMRVAGGVLGGGLGGLTSGGLERAFGTATEKAIPKETQEIMDAYERLGLSPTAATTGVGGKTAAMLEANVLPQTIGGGQVIHEAHRKNFEKLLDAQQSIAERFGAPAASKKEAGEDIQKEILTKWQSAKQEAGNTIGEIEKKFSDTELFEPKNLLKALDTPVGAAKVRTSPTGEPIESVVNATVDPLLKEARQIMKDNGGRLTFRDMKALSNKYGNALDRSFAQSVDDAQVSQIQRALRKDMEEAIKTRGDDTFKLWNESKSKYAQAMNDYRQAFKKMLGSKDVPVRPEAVYDILVGAGSEGGRANQKLFNKVWSAMSDEAKGNLASTVLTRMGNKDPSKLGDLEGFSLGKFLTEYRKLTPESKSMLFGQTGNKELEQAMDDLFKAAQSMTVTEKLASSSRSGTAHVQAVQLAAPFIHLISGDLPSVAKDLLFTIGGPWAAAHFLTSPTMVKQLAKSMTQIEDGMRGSARGMIGLMGADMAPQEQSAP